MHNGDDPEFEALLKRSKREFKNLIKPELWRREGFNFTPRRRRKIRKERRRQGSPVPVYENTPTAAAMLRTVRRDFLKGVENLPNNPRIKAVYAFGLVGETNDLVMNLDARKQIPGLKRWSFTGGGVEAGENLAEALHRELREELGLFTYNWTFRYVGTVPLLHSDTRDLAALFYFEISEHMAGRIRPRTREQMLVEPKPREFISAIAAVPSLQPGEVILDNHRNFWEKFLDWETRVLTQ